MMQDVHGKLHPALPWQKAVFNKTKAHFTSKLDSSLRIKLVKCYFRNIALYDSVPWALGKVDQKYLDSLEMRCWRMAEKISGTDCVKNEEVLHSVKEERNVLRKIRKRREVKWLCYVLLRNCLLKHVIE